MAPVVEVRHTQVAQLVDLEVLQVDLYWEVLVVEEDISSDQEVMLLQILVRAVEVVEIQQTSNQIMLRVVMVQGVFSSSHLQGRLEIPELVQLT